ncbi:hypothetical protein CQA57_00210 [Helicobacter anseris]|uniref:Beta-lactamase n=1 Tax=Helicobacter anseris TaxID=375926 RepID=A0A3D8JAQ9_9HELI|nr:tetratricopeptide repeat protein [Helicobacter anseris]RDU74512.1 hypothetical protein CQA57_00210 [Helicobacter anseris]
MLLKNLSLIILSTLLLFAKSKEDYLQKAVEAYKKENFLTAKEYYTKACESGNMRGCSGLGTIYERGLGVIKNLLKAKEYYEMACNNKDSFGCFHLRIIQEGDLAIDYYTILCDDDNGAACLRVGNIYYNGLNVPKDKKNAVIYYQKACILKNAQGCFNLGILYRNGEGDLETNPEIALAYFYLAKQYLSIDCKKGAIPSCNLLKSMEAYQLN